MKAKKMLFLAVAVLLLVCVCSSTAFAAEGDVAGAIEETWDAAADQIKTVVDNVVFPALDMILAIAFFVKLGSTYFEYRKGHQFEWAGPAILLACLIFTLTAPNYIWGIVGM
nr:DUF3852 domain-containing protein [uncultured Oscillibacter sp.]